MVYYNLIVKFLAGEISDKEMIVLKSWLEQDPENRHIFDKENELWQESGLHLKLENSKIDTAWIDISSRLGFEKNNINDFKILHRNNFRSLIVAAVVAGLVAVGAISLWIMGKGSINRIVTASTLVSTKEGEKAHIILPDSTEVILNSESTLQYNGKYNINDRTVKFAGEAFFNVSTNPEKPFVVKLSNMSISATGTRFNVFYFANEDRIETTLEEGTIQISIKGIEPINVKSGQQIVYFVSSEKVLVRDVVTDTYTSWKENKLRFNDTPFEEVLRRLSRKYNVKFEIANSELLNLKYSATFIDESIEEVMEMLKTVSPINYKIYNRTTINDKQYLKPRIVVWERYIHKKIP